MLSGPIGLTHILRVTNYFIRKEIKMYSLIDCNFIQSNSHIQEPNDWQLFLQLVQKYTANPNLSFTIQIHQNSHFDHQALYLSNSNIDIAIIDAKTKKPISIDELPLNNLIKHMVMRQYKLELERLLLRLSYVTAAHQVAFLVNDNFDIIFKTIANENSEIPFKEYNNKLVLGQNHKGQAIEEIVKNAKEERAFFPIIDDKNKSQYIIEIINISDNKNFIFPSSFMMIVAHQRKRDSELSQNILKNFYGLTPSQTKIAKLRSAGLTAQEISRLLNLGIETVRSHLKGISNKTGTKRFSDLCKINEWVKTIVSEDNENKIFERQKFL